VKAILLVGGEGTRLRPLTYDTPKQMLPIVGRPMIERVLEHLAAHGVDQAILSLGYLPDAFMRAYPEGVAGGVRLSYAVEPEPYDTAGALRFAADVAGIEETFVVLNGDVLSDMDVSALVDFHRRRGAQATIALHPVEDPSRFGVVQTDEHGRVEAFIEKPPADQAPTNLINAGTYVLEPAVLDRIPPGRRVSIERETFPALVDDGRVFALADSRYWLDTGTPVAYLQAHRDLLDGTRGVPPNDSAEELDGNIWSEGDAIVKGTVVGPSYLARDVRVSGGATVRGSFLGCCSIVEDGARVVDSVVLDSAHIAADASVEGSIVGPGATVGQRCSVRPVSVIGRGAILASGTVLDGARIPE
jgi:mannose-1-phosphate guanylyltransferase